MPRKKVPHYKTDSLIDKQQEETLEPCVKYVKECWVKWTSHWASKMTQFEQYYDRWKGKPPTRDEDWQSQFHKKLTWQALATLVSRFHSALFPVSAPIDCDTPDKANLFQTIIAKSMVAHWFKIGKISMEFLRGMRSSGIYGTGLFEDDWYVRTEKKFRKVEKQIPDFRQVKNQQTGEFMLDAEGNVQVEQIGQRTIMRPEGRFEVVEDRYRVRKSNIFAWRIHPHKLSDEDDLPVIKQEYITYDRLLKFQRQLEKYGISGFDNMEAIRKDKFEIDKADAVRLQKDGEYVDTKNPRLELLSYWGNYKDEKETEESSKLIMVVNRKFRLKLIDNPRWDKKSPLFHIIWTEDEKGSYYGIGLAEIGADAEDRANTTVNIRTDVKKKSVRGSGYYNANDKKINKKLLMRNTPGLMKPSSDPKKAVQYDTPPPLLKEDYLEEEVAVNDHREITGATTALLPTADVGQQHKTLGGLQLLSGQATQRLKPDLVMMEMMGIRVMANRAFLMTRQFYTEPETVNLIASEDELRQLNISKVYKIPPSDLIEKVEFFCTGLSETFEKMQNIDKLLRFIEVTGRIPIMQQSPQYFGMVMNMIKRIALWLGIEDVESLIPQIPGMPPGMGLGGPQLPAGGQPPGGQGAGGLPANIVQQIAQGMAGGQPPIR